MELDHQFNQFMKSDKRMSSSRAAKLQAYWRKICENEKKSQARNRELLQDFDRVEAHVAALAARTERLRLVQEQYQKQVDHKYPNWRQRYLEKIQKRQTADSISSSQANGDSFESYKLDGSRNTQQSQMYSPAESPLQQLIPDIPIKSSHPHPEMIPAAGSYDQTLSQDMKSPLDSDGYLTVEPSKLVQRESEPFDLRDDKYSPEKLSSSKITDTKQADGGLTAHRQVTARSSGGGYLQSVPSGGDISSRTDPFSSASGEDSDEDEREEKLEVLQNDTEQRSMQKEENVMVSSAKQDTDSIDSKPDQKEKISDKSLKEEALTKYPEEITKSAKPAEPSDEVSESSEDIESDLSLPLSENEVQPSSPPVRSAVPELPLAQGPELTTDGFCHLIQSLEHAIERNKSEISVYDGMKCSQDQKTCIAEDANAKLSLDRYDSVVMSRVLLQELPLLVQASPRGYLMSDQVLRSDRPILEVTVRSAITTNALPYWDHTLRHMVFLVKKGLFECREIAEMVAPLLVAKDSVMTQKAVEVVTYLLEEAVEEPTLDESSLTHTSMEETPASPDKERPTIQPEKVPPLNLDVSGEGKASSSEDEDSFFDQKVPLKETDAYKQMLQSAQSLKTSKESQETGKVSQIKDEDGLMAELEEDSSGEDDDDIEEAAQLTPPSSERSSGGRKKRNVLSSLGGADMLGQDLGHSIDKNDEKMSPKAQLQESRTGEMSSPEKSDIISSASETPRESGGYVPSAMDNSLKSSGRKSDALQRSSAFWGEESDLDEFESEMSVPMGTGNLEDDKDDFDFYD